MEIIDIHDQKSIPPYALYMAVGTVSLIYILGNLYVIPEMITLIVMGASEALNIESLSQLTGTALTVAVLIFMVHYFMKREERRETFISDVINKNTEVLIQLKEILKNGKL